MWSNKHILYSFQKSYKVFHPVEFTQWHMALSEIRKVSCYLRISHNVGGFSTAASTNFKLNTLRSWEVCLCVFWFMLAVGRLHSSCTKQHTASENKCAMLCVRDECLLQISRRDEYSAVYGCLSSSCLHADVAKNTKVITVIRPALPPQTFGINNCKESKKISKLPL